MAHGGGDGGPTMGGKIGLLLFLVVLAGVGLYIWNSGLIDKASRGIGGFFPSLSLSSSSSTSSSASGFFNIFGPGTGIAGPTSTGAGAGTGVYGGSGSGGESSGGYGYIPPTTIEPTPTATNPYFANIQIPAGFTASQISPFYKEVSFNSVYSGYGYYSNGRILLDANVNSNETVDVTGWRIQGNHGSEYIPQAVSFYTPSGFSPSQDIELANGQTLSIYSSPGSINLRLNECIGYLQNDLRTNPQLPLTCPYPNQSQISSFSGACQNYIETIPACTVPNTYSSQVPQNDYACQQYLSTLNYTGCFNAHFHDANFLSNAWWVWTGSNFLDQYHDIVNLYDSNGLLVDQYVY
jgi:hypothetical protein